MIPIAFCIFKKNICMIFFLKKKSLESLKEAINGIVNNTKLKKQNNPYDFIFENIASLKQEADQEDEYLIYDINGNRNNRPAYVFKTSICLTCRLGR